MSTHEDLNGVKAYARTGDGPWVPAVPEAYRNLLRHVCSCGLKFWTRSGYRSHYLLTHLTHSPNA